jgi:hypothetical protein
MMSKHYLNLPPGEAAILRAAAQIYAAYIISGQVREGEEKHWMKRALKEAMSFAKTIDQYDESHEEGPDEPAAARAEAPPPTRAEIEAELAGGPAPKPAVPAKSKLPEAAKRAEPPLAPAKQAEKGKSEKPAADRPKPIPIAGESGDAAGPGEEDDLQAVIDELCESMDDAPGPPRDDEKK